MVMPQLPQRVVDFDGNGRSVGYIASAFAFSYLLFQVPSGSLADRIGFKPLLIVGYLLCALAGLVFYYAASSNMIFYARLLQGAGEAPVWALAPALLSLTFPHAKAKVMGIYSAAMHIGLALGPVLGVALVQLVSRDAVFVVYFTGCLAGAVVLYFTVNTVVRQGTDRQPGLDITAVLRLMKNWKTLLTLSGITLYGASYGLFNTNIPVFLLVEKSFTPAYIGLFFSLFFAAISFSQVMIGPLSDRFGRTNFMIAGLLLVASGFIVMPACSFPLILLVLTVASFGMGTFYLASMAYLNENFPDSLKGTISGAYYLFWGCGYFCAPLLASYLDSVLGFQAVMFGYSSMALLVAAAMMLLVLREKGLLKE